MRFLLSLNLSHWIGSFSTVGLDSHLGFKLWTKRVEGGKTLHFSFLRGEGRRESWRRRVGTIFKTPAERDFQLAQKSRSTAQKSRTVWTAFNGLEIEGVWTVQIALIAGTKIEAVRTVQTAFKAVRFWAQKSRQHSVIFSGTSFELYGAFIAVRTVRIFLLFWARKSRAEFLLLHRNRGWDLLLFLARFSRKEMHRNWGSICIENETVCWLR